MSIINNCNDPQKILVMQLGPFGDILLTTSYFEHIKNKFPDSELIYLIKEKYYSIVADHPFIDNFILLTRDKGVSYYLERIRTIFKIRKRGFDVIIDQQNLMSTKIFTLFSGAAQKIGYKNSRFDFIYNIKAERGPQRYTASSRFDLVKSLGITLDHYTLYYKINRESDIYISDWLTKNISGKFLVISPGSPVGWKKWDIRLYADAAARISEKFNLTSIWLWGPNEKEDAQAGMKLLGHGSVLAPPTSLNQAAALLRKAELFLCNDGGINHIAAVVGVKTIALFGDTDPVVWSPEEDFPSHHHLHNPDHDSRKDHSFGITVEEVVAMAMKVLDA